MLKKILAAVFVTILAVVLILLKFDPSFIHNIGTQKKSPHNSIANHDDKIMTSEHAKHRDFTREATFPFENKEREQFAKINPKKFAIVKKMYYSWDYIHNAQGEYEWGHSNGEVYKGEFYVNLDHSKNLLKKQIISNGQVVEQENILLSNKVGWRQLPNKNIYSKEKIENNRKGSAEANELGYLKVGNTVITESEWYALIYNDYPNWSYKVETKNNIPVYQIKGTIPKQVSTNLDGRFTMTVAKDTGALLDLKCYGYGKKVIFFVTGKNIKINKGIENSVFQLNVSEDKKLPFDEFTSKTYGAQADTSKTGGVSQ